MLPFTKRPGRGDESGDHDVVTKDDIATSESAAPKAKGAAPVTGPRAKFASLSDEEMTNIMPSKSIGDALESARSSPRPAAGMPPPSLSSRGRPVPSPSSRPAAASATRSGKFVAMDDEEEDGRTVVRGAPKIVKRGKAAPSSNAGGLQPPTTVSPAAVIKATLESARAKKTGEHLMAPPPQDLLEDLADLSSGKNNGHGSEHTKILQSTGSNSVPPPGLGMQNTVLQSQPMGHGSIPPGSARPMSAPPPAMGVGNTTGASGGYPAQQSGGYPATQSGGYSAQYPGPVPSGSVSVPGVSMPAHFMVPQAPHSDGRVDPPGTAVTARTRVSGRPAMSWAMALMGFGLFVGVGALAVMRGNSDGFMETSASFVDPARAGANAPKVAAAGAGPVAVGVAVAPVQPAITGVPAVATAPVAVAPVAVAPVAPGVVAVATVAPVAVAPVAVAPVAVAPVPPAPPAVVAVAPTPTPKPAHGPRPAFRAPAPAAEEPVAAAPPPVKPTRGGKPAAAGTKPAAGDPSVDEEQKKALKQLQESQLESTF